MRSAPARGAEDDNPQKTPQTEPQSQLGGSTMHVLLVRRIYFANPQFAFFFITLVATRPMADRWRPAT